MAEGVAARPDEGGESGEGSAIFAKVNKEAANDPHEKRVHLKMAIFQLHPNFIQSVIFNQQHPIRLSNLYPNNQNATYSRPTNGMMEQLLLLLFFVLITGTPIAGEEGRG